MKIKLVRNATMRIEYAGQTILTDPCLAAVGTLPSYADRRPNPIVPLAFTTDELLAQIDLVLISHLHQDHFDATARERIPIGITLLCRKQDAQSLKEDFTRVEEIDTHLMYNGIAVDCTPARHGTSDSVLADMGTPCGYILRADGEPTLYWAGDTVWYDEIAQTISKWRPDVILTHSGGAVWTEGELIIMDAKQTITVCKHAPESRVIAIHMEAFDHCLSTRSDLRELAREEGIPRDRLLIPADGEEIEIR